MNDTISATPAVIALIADDGGHVPKGNELTAGPALRVRPKAFRSYTVDVHAVQSGSR